MMGTNRFGWPEQLHRSSASMAEEAAGGQVPALGLEALGEIVWLQQQVATLMSRVARLEGRNGTGAEP